MKNTSSAPILSAWPKFLPISADLAMNLQPASRSQVCMWAVTVTNSCDSWRNLHEVLTLQDCCCYCCSSCPRHSQFSTVSNLAFFVWPVCLASLLAFNFADHIETFHDLHIQVNSCWTHPRKQYGLQLWMKGADHAGCILGSIQLACSGGESNWSPSELGSEYWHLDHTAVSRTQAQRKVIIPEKTFPGLFLLSKPTFYIDSANMDYTFRRKKRCWGSDMPD